MFADNHLSSHSTFLLASPEPALLASVEPALLAAGARQLDARQWQRPNLRGHWPG